MLSEYELVIAADYILLIFGVLLVERFNKLGLDKPLFVQPLLVFKYFQSYVLF
jgi:hypothetical protein